ncbi:MAG: hypothetical protein R3A13_05765 [Bdellovibrionota bacterium]
MSSNDPTVTIVNALIRALSHKIRSPLSVILNELSVLESQLTPGETALAQKQCKNISEILKQAGVFNEVTSVPSRIDLEQSLLRCFAEVSFNSDTKAIVIDEPKFNRVLQSLAELLGTKSQVEVLKQGNDFLLSIASRSAEEPAYPDNYSLLSTYFSEKCGRDSFAAPLADLLLSSMASKLVLEVSDKIVLSFALPREI